MAKIYAPNKNYTGVTAGVPFTKGVGETDNEYLIKWFKAKGYDVAETAKEIKAKEKEVETSEPDTAKDKEAEKPKNDKNKK